jgi:ATP-binding cassette subfamily B (MDR/TAP) protein 1
MTALALGGLICMATIKSVFGVMAENITMKLRSQLYSAILRKDIGYFDKKDNAPGVISASMASDASSVNGATSEGLATALQSGFTMLAGIGIGFYFDWKLSLVCLAMSPVMMFGGAMGAKYQKGLSVSTDAASKDANLLAGDALSNFKTVISFAREE